MKGMRKWLRIVHRDLGYLMVGLILLYASSGLALNHADHWNPNFRILRRVIPLNLPVDPARVTLASLRQSLAGVPEMGTVRAMDYPSSERLKIFLDDGSILYTIGDSTAVYETIRRRPLLFEANKLHIHPEGWWLVLADFFSVALAFLALSGVLLLRGRKGFAGRGKWLTAASFLIPLAFLFYLPA